MTRKVLDICIDGCHLECIHTECKQNPFRVYLRDAGHRRQIAKYGDFVSVLYFLMDLYQSGANRLTTSGVAMWAKGRNG